MRLEHAYSRPFPDADVLAIDIETDGLDYRDNSIICIAVSDGTEGVVYDLRWNPRRPYEEPPLFHRDTVAHWLNHHIFDRKVVLHNAQFDLAFLREQYGCDFPACVWDTMLAEQVLVAGIEDDNGMQISSSLKAVALRRLNIDLDKTEQLSFRREGVLTDSQVAYALHDVVFLPLIVEQQRKELAQQHLGDVIRIEHAALPAFTDMSRTGVLINKDHLLPLLAKTEERRDEVRKSLEETLTPHVLWKRIAKYDELQGELDEWTARYDAAVALFERNWSIWACRGDDLDAPNMAEWEANKWLDLTIDKKDGKPKGQKRYVKYRLKEWRASPENRRPSRPHLDETPINLNSQQQVLAAFSSLGVQLPDLQNKTVQAFLVEAQPAIRDEILQPFLKYRKDEKLLTSFGPTLLEKISSDGRLRGSFRQIGTATGRPTCSSPNLLQIPADDKRLDPFWHFRRAFSASPDRWMVVCDYSQMELRILAQLSGDPVMRKAFIDGLDLHTYTASLMFGVPFDKVTDKQRKTSKTLNFGIVYGMGPAKLQYTLAAEGVYMTLAEAKEILDRWAQTYPGAAKWLQRQQTLALSQGYTATPLGRRRRFNVKPGMSYGDKGAIQRRGANHVIQGSNADLTKLAMGMIYERLNGRGTIVLQVYDEIVTEVDREVAPLALGLVVEAMETAASTVLTDVPVAVDGVITNSWSELDVV